MPNRSGRDEAEAGVRVRSRGRGGRLRLHRRSGVPPGRGGRAARRLGRRRQPLHPGGTRQSRYPEYKIALERATQSAAQEHISRARQFEEKDRSTMRCSNTQGIEMNATNRSPRRAPRCSSAPFAAHRSHPAAPRIEALREQARQARRRSSACASGSVASIQQRQRPHPELHRQHAGIRITTIILPDKATARAEDVTSRKASADIRPITVLQFGEPKPSSSSTIAPTSGSSTKRWWSLLLRVACDAQSSRRWPDPDARAPDAVAPVIMAKNRQPSRPRPPDRRHHRARVRSNDKPRAEVVIDVQILEVNAAREAVRFGANAYALGSCSPLKWRPQHQRGTHRDAALAAAFTQHHTRASARPTSTLTVPPRS